MARQAIVLLSGGIDSTVILAYALALGRSCIALSFDYGQRHGVELESARAIAAYYSIEWNLLKLPHWQEEGSALLSSTQTVPSGRTFAEIASAGIPSTYVPARNTLFLAYATGYAEICNAEEIYFGSNSDDTAPYPDCRPAFFAAFQEVIQQGTRQGCHSKAPQLCTPLLQRNKREVVILGRELKAPLELTFSCYSPIEKHHCDCCDACMLRQDALSEHRP